MLIRGERVAELFGEDGFELEQFEWDAEAEEGGPAVVDTSEAAKVAKKVPAAKRTSLSRAMKEVKKKIFKKISLRLRLLKNLFCRNFLGEP